MIVAFSVTPLGVGEDVGEYVADAADGLDSKVETVERNLSA